MFAQLRGHGAKNGAGVGGRGGEGIGETMVS